MLKNIMHISLAVAAIFIGLRLGDSLRKQFVTAKTTA